MKLIGALFLLSLPALAQFTTTAQHIKPVNTLPTTCKVNNGDVAYLRIGGAGVTGIWSCGPTDNNWTYAGSTSTFTSLTITGAGPGCIWQYDNGHTDYVKICSPTTIGTPYTFKWPTDGSTGYLKWTFSGAVATGSIDTPSGGAGDAFTKVTTSSSATPTFTASANTNTTFVYVIAQNVTSSTLAAAVSGQNIQFQIDGDGTHTFIPPTNVLGMANLVTVPIPSGCTATQSFTYDGTNANSLGPMSWTGTCGTPGLFVGGVPSAGTGVPLIEYVSNLLNRSASVSAVTVASAPTAGSYRISYYVLQSAVCTTGSNSVAVTFNWTDAGNARVLTTGSLSMGTAQTTGSYLSGIIPLQVASGDITYTPTLTGTCSSGTSTYNVHVNVERLQ